MAKPRELSDEEKQRAAEIRTAANLRAKERYDADTKRAAEAIATAAEQEKFTSARIAKLSSAEGADAAARSVLSAAERRRRLRVGDRMEEPEPFKPYKVRGIDQRSIEHRIHSAVGNAPYWGAHGGWKAMVEEAQLAERVASEARGQIYNPPSQEWRFLSTQRREQREREKKEKEEFEKNVVKKDQDQIKSFMTQLGLADFAEKFHSLEHVLTVKTVALRKIGLSCQQRKLLLKYTEFCRQRQARGLFPYAPVVKG